MNQPIQRALAFIEENLTESLQDVNTRMWAEWLPNCKNYRLAANLTVEVYAPPAEDPNDTYSEIWLPVEKI